MANEENYRFLRLGTTRAREVEAKLQATFAGGVATVDAANSDHGITLDADSTGDYDVAGLPAGRRVQVTGCHLDPGSDTPATTAARTALPRSFDAAAGTGKVLFFRGDTAALASPPDGARLYLTVKVETGVS